MKMPLAIAAFFLHAIEFAICSIPFFSYERHPGARRDPCRISEVEAPSSRQMGKKMPLMAAAGQALVAASSGASMM